MTADPIGGVWTYTVDLCAALQPLGVEVSLATLGASLSRVQRREIAALANVTLHESRYRLEWMPDPWADLAAAGDWLLALAERTRPDVVHLNHLVHGELPWRSPVLTVGHSCVLSWWQAVRCTPLPQEWAAYREAVTRSLRAAARVIAPTRAMLAQLQHHYGPFAATQVVPNARSVRAFTSARPKERFVLAAGRLWDEAKNVRALAAVAPSLSWPVHVAGEAIGPAGEAVALPAVRLLGRLSPAALAWWYARAAIYALPARYEPFGLTALEAALSGCALVLGDIPSLREIWGDAARYVPPDDEAALREELEELIADAGLRLELGARARERALRLSVRDVARAYWLVYRQLRSQRATAAAPPDARPLTFTTTPLAG